MDYFQLFDLKYYSWSQRVIIKGAIIHYPVSYACLFLGIPSFDTFDLVSRLLLAAALDTSLIIVSVLFSTFVDSIVGKRKHNFTSRVLFPCFASTIWFCYVNLSYDADVLHTYNESLVIYLGTLFLLVILSYFIKSDKDNGKGSDNKTKEEGKDVE